MFNLFRRNTLPNFRSKIATNYTLFNSFSSSSSSSSPKGPKPPTNHNSFAASYLVNACGFSPKDAFSASKRLAFRTPDRPDSVIAFLKNLGLTQSDVTKLVKSSPQLLHHDPEKSFSPKIDFFRSLGLSGDVLVKFLRRSHHLLCYSLENRIIPCFNFVKKLVQSDEKAVSVILRYPLILTNSFQAELESNAQILRDVGVPESNVGRLIRVNPRGFATSNDHFRKVVQEVKKLGFDPSKLLFVTALNALVARSNSTWENKVRVYKEWGWSHDEVLSAFRKNPVCMMLSEDNIRQTMDFFVNKMGWKPSFIADRPVFLTLSLEKRIAPRCMLYKDLLSKGLVEKNNDFRFHTWLCLTDIQFHHMVSKRFHKEAPELLQLYQERLDLSKRLDMLT